MLSYRTNLIKSYIERCHRSGRKPKISEISEAFGITRADVRKALAEIRVEHNPVVDFFGKIFGVTK